MAKILGQDVSTRDVYREIDAGSIRAVKVGRRIAIPAAAARARLKRSVTAH